MYILYNEHVSDVAKNVRPQFRRMGIPPSAKHTAYTAMTLDKGLYEYCIDVYSANRLTKALSIREWQLESRDAKKFEEGGLHLPPLKLGA